MEEDAEDTSQWTKEQWVKKLREIWRSPEDMKVRLHEMLRRYFSAPEPLFSDASSSSSSSSSETFARFLYLCTELQKDQQFVLEVVAFFQTWLESGSTLSADDALSTAASSATASSSTATTTALSSASSPPAIVVDGEARAKAFCFSSKCANASHVSSKFESLFQFSRYKDELKPEIDELLARRNGPGDHVIAARMIIALNLQKSYDFAVIVAPLVFSDNMQVVDAFVGTDRDLRLQLVSLFDLWASLRTNRLNDHLKSLGLDLTHKGFKTVKFNQRTLGKMTTNLVKKYGLNEEEACPLLLEYRERGFLRHQTKEFIQTKAVDEQTWADNVESVVRRRPKVAPAIVDILCELKDYHRAAKWVKKLELPLDNVHPFVLSRVKELPAGPVTFGEEDDNRRRSSSRSTTSSTSDGADPSSSSAVVGDAAAYLPFPLPLSDVVMVDTAAKYDAFLEELAAMLAASPTQTLQMGVDAEWPPQQAHLGVSRVALLQIAADSKVFLIDVLVLAGVLTDAQWVDGLGKKFIANADVCKLGFGLHDDFKVLFQTVGALAKAGVSSKNILELNKVAGILGKKAPRIFVVGDSPIDDDDDGAAGECEAKENGCESSKDASASPSSSPAALTTTTQQPQQQRQSLQQSQRQSQQNQRQSQQPQQQQQQQQQQQPQQQQRRRLDPPAPKTQGLSALVQTLLGKPLDKRPQCSDWNRRPLRESQIVYAALDALVLNLVYRKMVERIRDLNLQDEIVLDEMTESRIRQEEAEEKEERKKRKSERREEKLKEKRKAKNLKTAVRSEEFAEEIKSATLNLDESLPIVAPKSLRVVCDTMLQGLGRQLRLCGVDVRILSNADDHDVAAKVALDDQRVILTCGKTFDRLKKFVPPGRCVNVNPAQAKLQCLQVLQHFNVRVDPTDIFSRCQLCNCDEWTLAPCGIIYHLWNKFVDENLRRKGKSENWSEKVMRKSDQLVNWSPVRDVVDRESKPGEEKEAEDDDEEEAGETTADAADAEELRLRGAALGISLEDGTFESPISKEVVQLELAVIPQVVFDNVVNFYLCSRCGKIYWDGSHYERTNNIYADVLGFDVNNAVQNLKID